MGPRAQAFSYSRQIAPVIGAFIYVSLIELPVVHLLIPWDPVRLDVLIVSVWGLLWMAGMLASMKVFPHLLDEHGLRIRYGRGSTSASRATLSPRSGRSGAAPRRSRPSASTARFFEGTSTTVPVRDDAV